MEEGEIRMLAKLQALIAEMHAVNVKVDVMKNVNAAQIAMGHSVFYPTSDFLLAVDKLDDIAHRMRTEI